MANARPSLHIAYIALGSNLGDRVANLRAAIAALEKLGVVSRVSSFYETAPVGSVSQPDFVNAVIELHTLLQPEALMTDLLRLEVLQGRDRASSPPKGPRTLDLDLLSFDHLVMDTPLLTLPHPAIGQRAFVLVPLAEIAQQWSHPVSGTPVAQLIANLSQEFISGHGIVRKMEEARLPTR
ncbi:MAG TPA: 2-amino-4-hydroxy-6-hydroxymethyldihydropteridine diphosphokinase [Acidobacteriaceae bacterium]|nr:2-amino-4-hydroxy-6-hydroxymethyldihydropteridine diphosphokinase [Acidobacteriaceae bacterium]